MKRGLKGLAESSDKGESTRDSSLVIKSKKL
jgi:hypothetical protein